MKRILVIVAHPDDETLGMGGTIARMVSEGKEVDVIHMTDGVSARGGYTDGHCAERQVEMYEAFKILGCKNRGGGGFPDNAMDTVPLLSINQFLEDRLDHIQPDTIFTHFSGDLNIDHELTARAVLTACRPFASSVREIYAMEIPSSTECNGDRETFNPDFFVALSGNILQIKLGAFKAYESELRMSPHPRSVQGIENLAQYRGMQSGFFLAEGFKTIRRIK